jgi:dynein intermediate chain, cytosolic
MPWGWPWPLRQATAKSNAGAGVVTEHKPLHSFSGFTDYVYDARWSPVHPALFAAVDGMGMLTLWNLNVDMEVRARPLAVHTSAWCMVLNGVEAGAQAPIRTITVGDGRALNRVRWDVEGRKLAVGGADGAVYVYDVGEVRRTRQTLVCVSVYVGLTRVPRMWSSQLGQPRLEEWSLLQRTLKDLPPVPAA